MTGSGRWGEQAIHVIHNPVAGQGRSQRELPTVQTALSGYRHLQWHHTSAPGDAERWAAELVRRGAGLVVGMGGDGTLNEIVNGCMLSGPSHPRPRLAVIPTGSSNDFALALGIDSVRAACERIRTGTPRAVDIGRVQGETGHTKYFCATVGLGFIADVARERYRVRHVRGQLLYLIAALRALARGPRPSLLRLAFDGQPAQSYRLTTVSVNNCATVGGYILSPGATIADGYLNILLVSERSAVGLIKIIFDAREGRHVAHEKVALRRFRRLQIEAGEPLRIHLDGQVGSVSRFGQGPLQIAVLPRQLRVVA